MLQSMCEPSDAQRHSQPRGQPAGSCWCSHWALLHTVQGTGVCSSPHTSSHTWAGTSPLGCWRQGSSASREAMAPCPPKALQLSERREPVLTFLTGLCVCEQAFLHFFKIFFTDCFWNLGAYGSEITQSLIYSWSFTQSLLPQALLEGSIERRPDPISFYFILETRWRIQKACENPTTHRERKEKNLQTKKYSFICVPLNTFVNCTALFTGDISSGILWLTELHKLFASL